MHQNPPDRPRRLHGFPLALAAALGTWLLAAPFAAAQWVALGPEGGAVTSLAASPTQPGRVYAGLTYGGVFRSADGGGSWEPARGGLQTLVWDLAVDPADPEVVYAGTSNGVWVTRNGGADWEQKNRGLTRRNVFLVQELAVAPSSPGTVYAGSSFGLWKSTDGAETWSRVRGGLPDGPIQALAVHPTRAGTVYAGVSRAGLFKSEDGGGSWRVAGQGRGLGSPRAPAVPEDLALHPSDPETIYAAVRHLSSGIYRSIDGGTTWSHVGRELTGDTRPDPPEAVAVHSAFPETLVTGGPWGLFRSADGGDTWARPTAGVEGREVFALEPLPFEPGAFLAGTRLGGVFRSVDGGIAWHEANRGLEARPLGSTAYANRAIFEPRAEGLVADPRGSGRLYAVGSDGRLYGSGDWGVRWTRLAARAFGRGEVRDLRLHPDRPWLLFALVYYPPLEDEGHEAIFFRSEDGGRTWRRVGEGLPHGGGPALPHGPVYWDPQAPGALYLDFRGRVFRSRDDATTWSVWLEDQPGDLENLAPAPGGVLWSWAWVAGEDTCHTGFCPPPPSVRAFYRSVDGGRSWRELATVESEDGSERHGVDPQDASVLYAVRDGDFHRSRDGGRTFHAFLRTPFEPLGSRQQDGRALREVVDPADPRVRYRISFRHVVERSPDGGESWEPFGQGSPVSRFKSLVLLPRGPRVLLAASGGGALARPLGETAFPPPPAPPPGPALTASAFPGFRFWVEIVPGSGAPRPTRSEADCLPETLCVSGALPGRTEVLLRIVGPKPNGYLWPTLVKLTTSEVRVWIEQGSTGILRYYVLPGARPGFDELGGLFDRTGFPAG